MCDELTAADDYARARLDFTRREFSSMGVAAALASFASLAQAATPTSGPARAVVEHIVEVTTPDGTCGAFFVHPAQGRFPGVILWPDVLGLREVKKAMARRLAAAGYAVLAVNPYYRTLKGELGMDFAAFRTPEGQAKLAPARNALTPEAVTRDGAAFAAFLDSQGAVDKKRGIGTQGYCMSGPFTVRTAAASARVKAAASFHGGGLVTDQPNSPHRLLAGTRASYLMAIAKNDDARAPTEKDTLRTAAAEAKRPAEIEVYNADHGWCVPGSPAYNEPEAERAWVRLLALYAKL